MLLQHASLQLFPSMNWEWCNTCLSPLHSGGRGSRTGKFKAIDWNSAVQGWFAYRRPCLQRRGGGEERGEKRKGRRRREKEEEKNRRRKRKRRSMKRRTNHQLFNKINASCDFLRLKENAWSLWLHCASGKEMCLQELDLKLPFSIYWRFAYSMSRHWVEVLEDAGGTAGHMSVAFRATDKALDIDLLFWRKVNKAGKLQARLEPSKCTVTSSS